jgi:hypothetical protein
MPEDMRVLWGDGNNKDDSSSWGKAKDWHKSPRGRKKQQQGSAIKGNGRGGEEEEEEANGK